MKNINNKELLTQKTSAGVVLRPNSKELKNIYLMIKETFLRYGITTTLDQKSAQMVGLDEGIPFDELLITSDFLVTIGGDGTLISVARRGITSSKPILGIHLGTLGFLTSVLPNELDFFLEDFLQDDYTIDARMLLCATLDGVDSVAFNDIVIKGKSITHMVTIDAFVDGKRFNSYYGDGLVIATPTGSTAYNLSSGGPVVYPLADAFVVTPISAHSLTQRPLLLPCDFELTLKTNDSDGAIIIIDGQETYEMPQGKTITIKQATSKAKLIRTKQRDYFTVLSDKLNWGKK